jgi:succinate dehydrogenase flavin-adding protein (antitoxin of CptAB toxin-antitoxin module)
MQLINKNTSEVITIGFEPTMKNLMARNYYHDWIVVPINMENRDKIVIDGRIIETPLDTVAIKQQGIEFLKSKVGDKKKESFIVTINKADNTTINTLTDLQDTTLNNWIVIKNKIPQDLKDTEGVVIASNVRYVPLINVETQLYEFVPITEGELLRLNTYLTSRVDSLTQTTINITNMILTASDELVTQVYNMTSEEREVYAQQVILENTPPQ